MKKITIRILLILSLSLALSIPVFASLGEGSERVFDYSGLFSADEITEIQAIADNLRSTYGMDIVVLTSDESYEGNSIGYADDFFDYNGFGTGEERDGFLFFIDMQNRVPTISTCGLMIRYITDSRLSVLFDVGYDYLASGAYGDCVKLTLNTLGDYLNEGIPQDQYNIDEYGNVDYYYDGNGQSGHNWGMIIGISFVAGIIVGLIFYFANKRSYSFKGSQYRYDVTKNTEANITQSSDTYLRSSVVRTPKAPPPDSSGSSSSTHISSSGTTHGGGSGRSF